MKINSFLLNECMNKTQQVLLLNCFALSSEYAVLWKVGNKQKPLIGWICGLVKHMIDAASGCNIYIVEIKITEAIKK